MKHETKTITIQAPLADDNPNWTPEELKSLKRINFSGWTQLGKSFPKKVKGIFQTGRSLIQRNKRTVTGGAICLTIGCGLWVFYANKQIEVIVEGHSWERRITILKFSKVHTSKWCDKTPRDAYNIKKKKELHHTDSIQIGSSCIDDICTPIYMEDDVYEDKCYFNIDRWNPTRVAVSNGGLETEPYWPQTTNLKDCETVGFGCEKLGPQIQTFVVFFQDTDSKKMEHCKYSRSTWESFMVGAKLSAEKRIATGDLVCYTLGPNGLSK